MTEPRYPLSGKTSRHETLHEGVPTWLRDSVRAWLEESLDYLRNHFNRRDYDVALARAFDLHARLEDPLAPNVKNVYLWSVVTNRDDELILDFVHFLLPILMKANAPLFVEDIDDTLRGGGSVWHAGHRDDDGGLERRVDDTAMAAAGKAMAESGHAGKLLAEAWQKVYGRRPDPKGAYAKAILAVEEIAAPIVTPNDKKSTLGKIAQVMRDQGDWRYVLHEGGIESAQDAPLHQVQELWHRDPRHADGKGTYRDPSQQEAETALFLAVGLVHMFHNGLIARRS